MVFFNYCEILFHVALRITWLFLCQWRFYMKCSMDRLVHVGQMIDIIQALISNASFNRSQQTHALTALHDPDTFDCICEYLDFAEQSQIDKIDVFLMEFAVQNRNDFRWRVLDRIHKYREQTLNCISKTLRLKRFHCILTETIMDMYSKCKIYQVIINSCYLERSISVLAIRCCVELSLMGSLEMSRLEILVRSGIVYGFQDFIVQFAHTPFSGKEKEIHCDLLCRVMGRLNVCFQKFEEICRAQFTLTEAMKRTVLNKVGTTIRKVLNSPE
eukprot:921856_1